LKKNNDQPLTPTLTALYKNLQQYVMTTGQDYLKYVAITSEVALLPVTVPTGRAITSSQCIKNTLQTHSD
jgi:hypothetical protein